VDNSHPERFPRHLRIVRGSEYRSLYSEGRRTQTRWFVLFSRQNGLGHHRLGITVSRKVGNAVVRNRVKRLFREVFRRSHAEIPDSFDFILNARQGCAGAGYGVLRDDFVAAATKACRGESGAGA